VIEADEYDRSFLKLEPDIAVITAMDADHLDIYGTAENMENAFISFSRRVKSGGLLVKQFGLKRGKELGTGESVTYSLQNENADAFASRIMLKDGGYEFDVQVRDQLFEKFTLDMGGMHNVENAVAAIAIASALEIEPAKIQTAIANFKGVKRRFEYVVKNNRIVYIDDYAHHPEELKALITGAKTLFRQRKCTVIFQPHLFSRTRDLADGFGDALDGADEVVLLPVYPAREMPLEGVSSKMIIDKMKNSSVKIVGKEEIPAWVRDEYLPRLNKEFGGILITAGAGDIDTVVEPVGEILKSI
jgi:UDP-N-acetylmuramate--alanine ligase